MFASNFTIAVTHLKHLHDRDNLKVFSQLHTIASDKAMANHFCFTCGTLMYRIGEQHPGKVFMRTGTVDDFSLYGTKLKPIMEIFSKDRVRWLYDVERVAKL
ncbi:hypothetical protein LTR66_008417, partial [Elasticomyces elasticus]